MNDTAEALVSTHIVDAIVLARSAHGRYPWIDLDDLISDALLGLWQAAQRFDPSVGCEFMPFARYRITGEMISGLRRRGPRAELVEINERSLPAVPDPNPTIRALLTGLPERTQHILTLLSAGHTHAEVAEQIGLSRGRVSQLIAAHAQGES